MKDIDSLPELFLNLDPNWIVSRETISDLEIYADTLIKWQKQINLVAQSTLGDLWQRHILDSVQVFHLNPTARRWLDLGSGGGFPGLVIGIFLKQTNREMPSGAIALVESNAKKAAFLKHMAHLLALPVHVHHSRIEDMVEDIETPHVITARALAPLPILMTYTSSLIAQGSIAYFLKGREYETELTAVRKSYPSFNFDVKKSKIDTKGAIICVSSTLERNDSPTRRGEK